MNELLLFVGESGELSFIYDDEARKALAEVERAAQVDIRRAAHVAPEGSQWSIEWPDGSRAVERVFRERTTALEEERKLVNEALAR